MAINAAEVLEDAEESGYHIEPPPAAQLTREQAIALVQEAERLSIAPPQPASAEQATATLAENNARTRGTGPDWQGFGDDNEHAAAAAPTSPQNGKTTPAATAAAPLPFVMNEKAAIEWAMATAPQVWPVDAAGMIVRDVVKNSFRKLATADGLHGEALGRAWIAKIAGKLDDRAKAATITDAELDGDTDPVTAGDFDDNEPNF